MPEPLRVALRLLGLLLVALSITCLVLLWRPGPDQIAEAMGVTCSDDNTASGSQQCSSLDAASVLWTGFWVTGIAGLALCISTRPEGKGPRVIDLRRFRRS